MSLRTLSEFAATPGWSCPRSASLTVRCRCASSTRCCVNFCSVPCSFAAWSSDRLRSWRTRAFHRSLICCRSCSASASPLVSAGVCAASAGDTSASSITNRNRFMVSALQCAQQRAQFGGVQALEPRVETAGALLGEWLLERANGLAQLIGCEVGKVLPERRAQRGGDLLVFQALLRAEQEHLPLHVRQPLQPFPQPPLRLIGHRGLVRVAVA